MKKAVIVLLHTGYWVLYLLLIVCFVRLMQYEQRSGLMHGNARGSLLDLYRILFLSPIASFAIFPGIVGFYSFYTVLFSRFLKRKRILALILSGTLVALCGGILSLLLLRGFWDAKLNIHARDTVITITLFLSLLTLVHGMIGLVLRGFVTSYGDIQLKEDLNRKNYEMELALVKSQINPHFLFNTINNIDVLIGKDAPTASAYLNKLSDIMRFMLYETKTEKVALTRELGYIEKYLDLQKIRTANPDYVNFTVEGPVDGALIEPMLFIPFIENAFKHAVDKKIENTIRIRFVIEKDRIVFECENHYKKEQQHKPDHGGLGNGLIRKRLELLYPGRHTLAVSTENETYKAKLVLEDAH